MTKITQEDFERRVIEKATANPPQLPRIDGVDYSYERFNHHWMVKLCFNYTLETDVIYLPLCSLPVLYHAIVEYCKIWQQCRTDQIRVHNEIVESLKPPPLPLDPGLKIYFEKRWV